MTAPWPRRNDLIAFAQRHGLKIGTIAISSPIAGGHDRIVERALESDFDSRWGGKFRMHVYVNPRRACRAYKRLVKGDVTTPGPVLVRMHALNVLDDVAGRPQQRARAVSCMRPWM